MAIVKMKRLSAIGLREYEKEVLEGLQRLGTVELSEQSEKLKSADWAEMVTSEKDQDALSGMNAELGRIREALDFTARYDTAKKPLLSSRRRLSERELRELMSEPERIEEDINCLAANISEWNELKSRVNALENKKASLMPWLSCELPLELSSTEKVRIYYGVIPASYELDSLKAHAEEVSEATLIELIASDQDQQYICALCMKEDEEIFLSELRNAGFNLTNFKGMNGTPGDNLAKLDREIESLNEKAGELEKKFVLSEAEKQKYRCYYDEKLAEAERVQAKERLLATKSAFYFDGWVPEKAEKDVEKLLAEKDIWYECRDAEEGEEAPTLMQNNSLIYPVQSITELYSLPKSYEVDPTPIFAAFYIVFFGMMFADIAYGLVLAGLTAFALVKYKPENLGYRLIKTLMYCGISTAVWGVLFGGFLGDMPSYLGVPLEPLWINPLDNAMFILAFSCVLGVIHLFVGMGIKAYMQIRNGKFFDAFCDVFIWYVFIIGLGLLLFGDSYIGAGAGSIGKYMAIAGAVVIVGCEFVRSKGIGKFKGLWNLYGTTSYLADILSYSRLLALGLASAVIAQVFNMLGSMLGTGIVGIIGFVIVALIGHVVNFGINALGSFVHASRLQYVEFFGKFYEGGGRAFKPFARNGKYTVVEDERRG